MRLAVDDETETSSRRLLSRSVHGTTRRCDTIITTSTLTIGTRYNDMEDDTFTISFRDEVELGLPFGVTKLG